MKSPRKGKKLYEERNQYIQDKINNNKEITTREVLENKIYKVNQAMDRRTKSRRKFLIILSAIVVGIILAEFVHLMTYFYLSAFLVLYTLSLLIYKYSLQSKKKIPKKGIKKYIYLYYYALFGYSIYIIRYFFGFENYVLFILLVYAVVLGTKTKKHIEYKEQDE